MDRTIKVPPFPPLNWDGYFWVGEVRLPSWVGFQTRRGGYASISKKRSSDGSVRLRVEATDKTPPDPEQVAAFRHLLDNEAAVANSVGLALLDYYPGERNAFLKGYNLKESDEVPEIRDLVDLRPLVGLSIVHVLSLARDGASCVGFEFGCVWDDEHGAGVMTHLGRVIGTGQADCAFEEWMAKQGLDAG